MSRIDTLALVLAGGPGTRLEVLTERRVKPAMPYAGVYRLIDLPLSNLHHSRFEDVWVLQQYRPHDLNWHLANGRPWDLDRTHGGLRALPPHEGASGRDGFAQGNADAIYQHLPFIREAGPERILVLSSDHIYTLDFAELEARHRERGADVTMVTTEVDREAASRFSVVETDGEGRVTDFHYKPDDPPAGTVGAEVFIYEADALLDALEHLAEETGEELEDYGDHLLPFLVENKHVDSYPLEGYWRDAGTVESYWQGHMDLLRDDVYVPFNDTDWPILTSAPQRLPARLYESARTDDALVSPGGTVRGTVARSVIGPGVTVEEGAVVRDSIVFRNTRVEAGARVDCAIIDENVTVGKDAQVGEEQPTDGGKAPPEITLVGMERDVEAGTRVEAGAALPPPEEAA